MILVTNLLQFFYHPIFPSYPFDISQKSNYNYIIRVECGEWRVEHLCNTAFCKNQTKSVSLNNSTLNSQLSTLTKGRSIMALDGAFLRHIKKELEENLINSKVDKIYQPSKDEIILSMRSREGVKNCSYLHGQTVHVSI